MQLPNKNYKNLQAPAESAVETDPVTTLKNQSQQRKQEPTYGFTEEGPSHCPTFTCQVMPIKKFYQPPGGS